MATSTQLKVTVSWNTGRKEYTVQGTKHAGNLIKKFAGYRGFLSATVHDFLTTRDGERIENPIMIQQDQAHMGNGKFACLFDRNNTHYGS